MTADGTKIAERWASEYAKLKEWNIDHTLLRLSAPVSDAEINVFCWGFTYVVKARFDLIIAARATPPAQPKP